MYSILNETDKLELEVWNLKNNVQRFIITSSYLSHMIVLKASVNMQTFRQDLALRP